VTRSIRIALGLLVALTAASGSTHAQAPATPPSPGGPSVRPAAEDPRRPEEAAPREETLAEDRPFTGDPGPEPPPPPVRPRDPDPPRPDGRATARPDPGRLASTAAPVYAGRPDLIDPKGPNIFTVGLGMAAGLTDDTTGGFRLHLAWSYQLTRFLWFDLIADLGFGTPCHATGRDPQGRKIDYACGMFRGIGVGLLAGLQYKFVNVKLWRAPVVPFVRAAVGADFIVSDGPNDGAALAFRLAGGVRYHVKPKISLGAELAFTLGPAFRKDVPTGFYGVIDVVVGVEFLF
jgi:hypothetical protein